MKRKTKVALLALTGVAAVGVVFWMRELASWRPVKMGQISSKYSAVEVRPSSMVLFSAVERSHVIPRLQLHVDSQGIMSSFPLKRGAWDGYYFQELSSQVIARCILSGERLIFQLHDAKSGRLERRLKGNFGSEVWFSSCRLSDKGRILNMASILAFSRWDVATGRLLRSTRLQTPYSLAGTSLPTIICLSADNRRVIGYSGTEGRLWSADDGRLLKKWSLAPRGSVPSPSVRSFSPDARFIAFCSVPKMNGESQWQIRDASTGRLRWQFLADDVRCFSDDSTELVLPGIKTCQVHDVATGRVLRQLRGPLLRDGRVLRVTPNSIYTISSERQIFRWRAR